MLQKNFKLVNIISFQIAWWITAFLVSAGYTSMVLLVQLGFLALHGFFIREISEWKLIFLIGAMGYAGDSLLEVLGYIQISPSVSGALAPLWILGLWLLFSCTIRHSLTWLFAKPILAAVLGAVFGPATYYLAGVKFGFILFASPIWIGILLQAVLWALLMFVASFFVRLFKKELS